MPNLTTEEKLNMIEDITVELMELTNPTTGQVLYPDDLSTTNEIVGNVVGFLRETIISEEGVVAELNKVS